MAANELSSQPAKGPFPPLKNQLLLLGAALFFVGFFYHAVLLHPNSYLFGSNGDAIKNYYTYAHYIEHNKGWIEFDGMNYPYGEHFLYTDCHPLLASIIRSIATVFPGITQYDIGILNFLMIFSLVVTAYILFLIFWELRVGTLLSILGSIAILSLEPQIYRITGHPALSYGFAIPLTIYWLLRLEHSGHKPRYFVFLSLSNLAWFFTHAYLGMICTVLVAGYGGIRFLADAWDRKRPFPYYITLAFGTVLPVLVFFAFTKLTDTHTGRSNNPWGIFELHASFNTVFLPHDQPFGPLLKRFYPDLKQDWEGWSYIGVVSILGLIFYAMASVWQSIRQRKPTLDTRWVDSRPLRIFWVASWFILLFSMLYPFRWGLENWLDKLAVIKQFRSIGRFAWVFYFVTGITAIYLTQQLAVRFMQNGKKVLAYLIIIIVPVFFGWEGVYHHRGLSKSIVQTPNLFDVAQLDKNFRQGLQMINPDDYQALIPLPYYHIGSENFTKQGSSKTYKLTELFGYHLNQPTTASYLTRISLWESKNLMQLFSPNFYEKKIQGDLHSDKPFLLLYTHEPLTAQEQYFLDQGEVIVENDEFTLLSLPKSAFFSSTLQKEVWDTFYDLRLTHSLYPKNGFLVTDTTQFFYYDDFDTLASRSPAHSGLFSYAGEMDKYNIPAKIDGKNLVMDTPYIIRFWMYNGGENYGQDKLNSMAFVIQRTAEGENWMNIQNPSYSQVIDGDWSMVEIPFTPDRADASYELTIKGNEHVHVPIFIDDVLIYDARLTLYRTDAGKLFMNNHTIASPPLRPIGLPSF